MKVLTLFFGLFSFIVLQNSSCNNQKILKEELTSKEISILKEQPSFVQDELIRIYNEKGSLNGVNVIQSTQNGKPVYFIGGQGEHQILDKNGEMVRVKNGKELQENTELIIGEKMNKVHIPVPKKTIKTPPSQQPIQKDITLTEKGVSKERLKQLDQLATSALKQTFKTFRETHKSSQMAQVFAFDATDGNTYFMFDEGMALDLPAYVLNEKGDTVCVTGGMRRAPNPEAKPCPQEADNTRVKLWSNQ